MKANKWRNPYAPLGKKPVQATQARMSQPAAATSAPRKLPLLPLPIDVRASVMRMRNNIKGISTTIRQMEETMDTLYGAVELFQSFGRKSTDQPEDIQPAKTRRKRSSGSGVNGNSGPSVQASRKQAAESPESVPSEGNGIENLLANIDIGQVLSLLQSPLVQSLIQQNLTTASSTSTKRKKEG
ncbi:hypothetical protein EDM56_25200 [Brevibacillus fluminis]|uniref:Uncharacterized protein n=1 Tax=Brevibacillus fluminis TaxID=511487 RepID=A0A3M8D164_9BACL|nr:hypothetical protein [Brevibacillus fluminis]RNB81618.1 hypothetical protein EDM56_25200 [Brevibacillus fluminis]